MPIDRRRLGIRARAPMSTFALKREPRPILLSEAPVWFLRDSLDEFVERRSSLLVRWTSSAVWQSEALPTDFGKSCGGAAIPSQPPCLVSEATDDRPLA